MLIFLLGPSGFFGPSCEYFVSQTTTTPINPITTTTTTTTTTAIQPNIVVCQAPINTLCKNNAACYLVNSASLICVCAAGFTGMRYLASSLNKNFIILF